MPVLESFEIPEDAKALPVKGHSSFYIAFLSSKDPSTKQPWCPDVRATLPTLEATFQGVSSPTAAFVEVGQRPEWKEPSNVFRTRWNVHNVPTLVRYQKIGDSVQEVGRLIEGEILDSNRLQELIAGENFAR